MGELLCQSSGILQFLARAVAEEKPTKDLVQYSRAERPMVAVHSGGSAGGGEIEMRDFRYVRRIDDVVATRAGCALAMTTN